MAMARRPGLGRGLDQAGYAILAEEGIEALNLNRLCARVGATKYSFYWHLYVARRSERGWRTRALRRSTSGSRRPA